MISLYSAVRCPHYNIHSCLSHTHFKMAPACCLVLVLLTALLLGPVYSRGPCDPLVPEYCLLPFPNSFYTVPSSESVSGVMVNMSHQSLPRDTFERHIDPTHWNTFDGFSLFPSILTYFPDLSSGNLPSHWDIRRSLSPNSSTLILNLDTGEFVPHFAELDTSLEPFTSQHIHSLMLWPAQSLTPSSHYLIVLRNLMTTNGTLVRPSPAFAALRDEVTTTDPDIEYRREAYQSFFQTLSSLGVERGSIQLMWDFTTASEHSLTSRSVYMRDDAFRRVEEHSGPIYSIVDHKDDFSDHIFRRIMADMLVPVYLNEPLPGAHLVIDKEGYPVYQSMDHRVRFRVLIPHSVANGSVTNPLLIQYGHGLFADESEVETDFLQKQANEYGYILFACNLWGMANFDVPSLVLTLIEDVSNIRVLPDQLTQGVVNQLLLMKLMKGEFSDHPLMKFNRRKVIDPAESYFYGISMGGVMGEVYMALTTDVKRGVLGVPGGSFGLLLPRSIDFANNFAFIRVLYPDPVDYTILISLINMIWSRAEPNAYMSYITKQTLPRTPSHQILYQYGLGDAQVNILALYTIARSAQAKMFASNVKERFSPSPDSDVFVIEELFGFQFEPDDSVIVNESVAVGFDCGAPPEPMGNVPPNAKTDTHELPRRARLAHEQFDLFIRTGEIRNFCNGPCNDCSQP